MDWQAAGTLTALEAAVFSVTGRLESGRFEHASLQINFGGLSLKDASASINLFCREVMPAIRANAM